jgi:hypothetical protein
MTTTIRKALPADAQVVADIFNGFVTRHATLGVKPSWTAENVLPHIAGEHTLTLIMEVDGIVSASFVLWIENGVARVQSASWTAALETLRPDPQITFGNWMADHQVDIEATQIEALWYKNNPFGGLILRAAAANLLRPTGGYVGNATEVTDEGDFIHMIATLDTFGTWFKQRKTADWTRLYKS